MCNLFENLGPSEWLLYISEWEYNGQTISNIRVTTKVAVHCILSNCPQLKNIGSMILYNIAIKEVKTVVCGMQSIKKYHIYKIYICRYSTILPWSWPWPFFSSSRAVPTKTRSSAP